MNDKTETRPHIGMPAAEPEPEFIPGSIGDEAMHLGRQVTVPDEVDSPMAVIEQAGNGAVASHLTGALHDVAPNPLAMLGQALAAGHDVDKLGKLMDLAERYEANQARKEFAAAMSKFQATCPPIAAASTAFVNTKDGGSYSYSYADLDNIMATIRPTLRKCGLSVRFDTQVADDGTKITSLCHVMHKDGHKETSTFVAPIDNLAKMNDSQKMGSANSYACRYNLCNALALTAGDDDDGAQGEVSRGAAPAPKATDVGEFFPIGKHKGDRWDAVPIDYMEWCVANIDGKPDVVAKCKEQIAARTAMDDPAPAPDGEPTLADCARWITDAKTADQLAEAWSLVPAKHQPNIEAFHATRATELAG